MGIRSIFMSNVLRLTKQTFTWSVVVATILWSMGVAALVPMVANAQETCPTLEAGDLFKVPNQSAVYLLNADMERMYFPHSSVYRTWYSDFSGVVEIPNTCVDNYPAPSTAPFGVNYRPGSRLVKVTISPSVYAVLPGNTKAKIGSEEVAKALYGDDWASKVMDVADPFWPNYANTGADMTTAALHDGMLVKTSGSSQVWSVSDGMLWMVDGSLGFLADDVRTVSSDLTSALEAGSGSVTTASLVGDPSQLGGISGTTSPTGVGTLSVALSASTQASTSIISDSTANEYPQAQIPFTTVNFSASSDSSVNVTSVQFKRNGIASDSDLGTLYLYDGNTLIEEYTSFNDKVVTFTDNSGLFTVPAGSTKSITLRGDLARGSTSVAGAKTIGFEVSNSAGVTSSAKSVTGSFPVVGNLMTTAQVTDLGHLYFAGSAGSNGTSPSSVKADAANTDIWSINVTGDSQDMEIRKLMVTMVGTIDTSDLRNVRLEVAGVQHGDPVDLSSDKTLTFNLAGNPIEINAGQTKQLTFRGDMYGGSGRVFKLTVQKSYHVELYDTEYGVYVTPSVNSASTAFGVVQSTTGNGISVDSGTLTLGLAEDAPNGNIPDAANSVTLAKFSFDAVGEKVRVDTLNIDCSGTGADEVLQNVKLLVDGSQVGTTDSSLTCDDGIDHTTFTFGNTFEVNPDTTRYLSIVADTTGSNIAADDTLSVSLNAGSSNATALSTLTTLSTTAQTSHTLTVKAGTVSVAENTAFGDKSATQPTGTQNAKEVKVASFIVSAGTGEAVDVTQFTLKDADGTSQMGDNFQNLKLVHDGSEIGTKIGTLDTSGTQATYSFTPSSAIRLSSGEQYVVDVYADIKSSAQDSGGQVLSPVIIFDDINATGVTTASDAGATGDVDLQNGYIAASGNLNVEVSGDTPTAEVLPMGSTEQTVAQFKFTANASEDIRITDLTFSSDVTNSATGTLRNIKLYDGTTQIGTAVNFGSGTTTTHANAVFTNLNWVVPKDTSKELTVKADVTTYNDAPVTGGSHTFHLLVDKGSGSESVVARGVSSGVAVTGATLDYFAPGGSTDADVQANTMTIYKTELSVAFADDSPSGSSVGSDDQIVAKINITNAANAGSYTATIEALNFAISQTGISNNAGSSDRQLKVYKDSISSGNLLLTTQWESDGQENFGDTKILDADMTDATIAAGTTKLFIVTMDTQDAGSDDKLSISMSTGDVEWGDSTTSTITAVDSLPLTPKTLTY